MGALVVRKMSINGQEYDVGVDIASGDSVTVTDRCMKPTAEYPDGSWLHKVGDRVEVATGYFAIEHPGKPSPYFHDGPPFFVVDFGHPPWEKQQNLTEKSTGTGV